MSRAKGRSGVLRVSALLAGGALTHLIGGPLLANSPADGLASPPPVRAATDSRAVAKSKLLQARDHLARGHLDTAEVLVTEAAGMKVAWTSNDDTPQKVQQDIAKAKQDPKVLLLAARGALARKDLAKAEQYARLAEQQSGVFTFGVFSDSPSKVLADVQTAKRANPNPLPTRTVTTAAAKGTEVAQVGGTAAPEAPIPPPPGVMPDTTTPAKPAAASPATEEARTLVKKAREAMAAKNYDEARKLSAQARAKKGDLGWWEDGPDRIDADLQRGGPAAPATAAAAKAATPAPAKVEDNIPRTKEEARAMLVQGRRQLADGKLEESAQTAQRVKAQTGVSWGLFEDSPDRLAIDINKARAQRDKGESARLLVEGRKLYEKGDYEGATRCAYRAEKLHGTYSIWDLGDRPQKLLADVQTAQARTRKSALPPSTAVVKNETPTGTAPAMEKKPEPAPVVKENGDRLKAQQLVAEAQRCHREGKLVEAHQKCLAAKKLNVEWSADEPGPDFVYQQVTIEVRQKVDGLVRQANACMTDGKGDMAVRTAEATKKLDEARSLVVAFGQDAQPIDARLAELRGSGPALPPVPGVAQVGHQTPVLPDVAPAGEGKQILESARQELRKGETANARRLAEKALTGNHGVKDEAMALLRSIDTEEFNQKQMANNKTFDAAMSAYNRREFDRCNAMIAAIDLRMLDVTRQSRLREVAMTPEMTAGTARATDKGVKPAATNPVTQVGLPPLPGTPLPAPGATGTEPGRAVASDSQPPEGPDLLDKHKKMQKILFESLRQEGLDVQKDAADKFKAGQADAALEVLQDYLAKVQGEKLEAGQLAMLKRPIDSRLSSYRLMKAQKELAQGAMKGKRTGEEMVASKHRAEELKQKNVEKLMKDFNVLFKEGKYAEAESLAMRALELDPDNTMVTTAITLTRRQRAVNENQQIKDERAEFARKGLNWGDKVGPSGAIDNGLEIDQERHRIASKRTPNEPIKLGRPTEKDKAIERQLTTPITISFDSTPLSSVLGELRDVHGINIVPDMPALQEAGVSLDSPISIKLDQISLKSALNLILHQVRLTHVIRDEVLMITTEEHAKGKLVTVTYPVADLIVPVENYGDVRTGGPQPTNLSQGPNYTPTPNYGPQSMVGGQPVGNPLGGNPPVSTSSNGGTTVTKRNATNTMEEQLIKLITNSIATKSWSDQGGAATVEYYPLMMSLVINQTPDIQEQIQDLLTALRKLQDQEVSVEVRFISVAEDFFERIGVNFNMNVLTDNARFQPMVQNNAFAFDNVNFINAFRPGRALLGLTPAGSLTPTLDIPITQSSFFQTIPAFGGYTTGGLSMGLAFLSDIQVFLFLEAAQGDVRTNVMQAPKLTLFNGQTATISVTTSQNLVTGVNLVPLAGGQFGVIPTVASNPLNSTTLTVNAVISADRRFVRMSLTPNMTNLLPGQFGGQSLFGGGIPVFPVVVPIFTTVDGFGSGQPVVFTQYVQQPTIASINIQTTVAVPDGGTVLLGGLKSLSESRSEFGPPLLSKVPYINRLFKNTGYGRETESLLIMVTPRIIIQQEEEERQTEFVRPGGGSGF